MRRYRGGSNAASTDEWRVSLAAASRFPFVEQGLDLCRSLTPEFVEGRAAVRGLDCPPRNELRAWLCDVDAAAASDPTLLSQQSEPCGGLAAEWCQRVLQRREELRTAASTVVQRCAALGVVFLELRVCPYAHCREGLTPAEALAAVCDGFADGASVVAEERCASGGGFRPVEGGVLLHALRERGPAEAAAAVLLARQFAALATGERPGSRAMVLGMSLGPGGAPGAPPLRAFDAALRAAVAQRLPLCVTARLGTDEPAMAMALGAQRLRLLPPTDTAAAAHVVSERSASALATLLRGARATATFALSADLPEGGGGAYSAHPLRSLLAAGVAAGLCTDALLASGPPGTPAPTPAGETAHAVAHAGLTWQGARSVLLNAARGAFCPPAQRVKFLKDYEAALDDAFEAAARASASGALPAVGGSSPQALAAAAAAAARPQVARLQPRAADPFGSSLYGDAPPSPLRAPQDPLSVPVLRSRQGSTPPGGQNPSGDHSAPRFAPFMQLPPNAVDVTHPRDNEERVLAAARTLAAQPAAAAHKPVPRTTSGRALADLKAGSGGGGLRNAQSFASMKARGFSEHSLALTEDSVEGSAAEGGYWTGSEGGATGAGAAALAARAIANGAERAEGSPQAGLDKISRLQREAAAEHARSNAVAEPSAPMVWLRAALGRMC